MVVQVTDPFGASTTAVVSIAVVTCEGRPFAVSLASGELMPMIVPPSFAEVRESAWETVTLASAVDGTSYASALSASWAEGVERFILTVDGGLLPLGTYELTVPLGNGETVELTIEVQ